MRARGVTWVPRCWGPGEPVGREGPGPLLLERNLKEGPGSPPPFRGCGSFLVGGIPVSLASLEHHGAGVHCLLELGNPEVRIRPEAGRGAMRQPTQMWPELTCPQMLAWHSGGHPPCSRGCPVWPPLHPHQQQPYFVCELLRAHRGCSHSQVRNPILVKIQHSHG